MLPQVPVRNLFSATTITIPDGTSNVGGLFTILDYIIADVSTDATANRSAVVTVSAGGGSVMVVSKLIPSASSRDGLVVTFPVGFPVVGSDGNPLQTITVAVSGSGITQNGLTVGWHYRRFNG